MRTTLSLSLAHRSRPSPRPQSRAHRAAPVLRRFAQAAFAIALIASPQLALASNTTSFTFISWLFTFQLAVICGAAAMCTVGIVMVGSSWFNRAHEGLGVMFWGGLGVTGISAFILSAALIVSLMGGAGARV